ncbi:MAG TPA: VWA domain-containing protein [Anaerolineales bacterium]|jgi:Ca-activated chloride channel family protein|nr:VWA domain-containing protein [Anaerolineales bacterium]
MSLLWPGFLYLFVLIPLAILVYLWVLRRRSRFAVRYSSLSLVREAAVRQSWLRKHLPFILFLLALTSLVFALGRPVATVLVPSNKATVIMAIDVSRSMCSTDIPPNRLMVAKEAALSFIRENSSGRQVGIVAFAGFAELIQPPTTDLRLLENAIDSLVPARRTAIGSAILRSIDAIAEVDNRVEPSELRAATEPTIPTAPDDEYVPHIIVLLTDGASNAGPLPMNAAQQAVERGVRVYTIGFGTVNNSSPMNCGDEDPFGFGGGFGSPFGGGGGGGGFRREIDEETLKQVADTTGGEYYVATSAGELQDVFANLPTYVIATRETTEISVFFTAIAVCIAILAMILSVRWHPLP